MEMLEKNVASAMTPLTDREKVVMDEINKKFFKHLSTKHWENKELLQYKKELSYQ